MPVPEWLIAQVACEPPVSGFESLGLRHPRICRQIRPEGPGGFPDPVRGVPRNHVWSGWIEGKEKCTGRSTGIIAKEHPGSRLTDPKSWPTSGVHLSL